MDMTREQELQFQVDKLQAEKLGLEIALCETQIAAFSQMIDHAMEKLPLLKKRVEEARKELKEREEGLSKVIV